MSNWIRDDVVGDWHLYRAVDNTHAWDDGVTCACGTYFIPSGAWTTPTDGPPTQDVHVACSEIAAREAHWQAEIEGIDAATLSSRTVDLAHEIASGLGSVVVTLYPALAYRMHTEHVQLSAVGLKSDLFGSGETFAVAVGEILAALERLPTSGLHVTFRDAD